MEIITKGIVIAALATGGRRSAAIAEGSSLIATDGPFQTSRFGLRLAC